MDENNPKQLVHDFQQLTENIIIKVTQIKNDLITLVNHYADELQRSLLGQFVQI